MVVRWVACLLATGLGCTVPNELFKVRDDASTGDPADPSTGATDDGDPEPASSSDESGDPPPDTTTDAPMTTAVSGDPTGDSASATTEPSETTGDAGDTGDPSDTTTAGPAACTDVCGTPGCGACPDAEMVAYPEFAIDAREVDNGQYQQFLAAGQDPAAVQGPACAWNQDFTPTVWPVDDGGALPVVNVDWCDARAFCEWSGKRLCGSISGGPAPISDTINAKTNQWYRACSNGEGRPYPYGPIYNPFACNGADAGFGFALPVGLLLFCEAAAPGLLDLSGNVWEWVDSCTGDAGADDQCLRRGGSFYSSPTDLRCDLKSTRRRDDAASYVGFRCCTK